MKPESAEAIAAEVSELCVQSGLGFLLARVVVDGILDGLLDPADPGFGKELRLRAFDLLLAEGGGQGQSETSGRAALLQALALAPDPGIPLGEAWQAMSEALDEGAPAGTEEQLGVLNDFRRFIVEEQHEGKPAYRWFHPGLRDALRSQAGGYPSEPVQLALRSLLELREGRMGEESALADWFLVESLPEMIVESGDDELMRAAMKDAPEAEARRFLDALSAAAADRRALGDRTTAAALAQKALLLSYGREDSITALVRLGQAEALTLDYDLWRDGRDMSRSALQMVERLLDEEPGRVDLLEAAIRATRMLVRTLGIGAFDAGEGQGYIERMLEQVAAADPEAQTRLAPVVAELLQSYADSLTYVTAPEVRVESADAAAQIRGLMVEAGREDLRLPFTESLVYAWKAREAIGDLSGLPPFRAALAELLAIDPMPPEWILRVTQMVGELSQALGFGGRTEEALAFLDRAVRAFEPSVAHAPPNEGHPLGLAALLDLRSSVLMALGRADEALEDALAGLRLADRHSASGLDDSEAPRITLALRLLERGRWEEALAAIPAESVRGGPRNEPEAAAQALVVGTALRRRGEEGEGVSRLLAALAQLDPGDVQPAPRNTEALFVTFGVELRIGFELAAAFTDQGDEGRAVELLDRATDIFLRRHVAASPARLLLLEPRLRELSTPLLERCCEEPERWRFLSEPWSRALPLLRSGEWVPTLDEGFVPTAVAGEILPKLEPDISPEANVEGFGPSFAEELEQLTWPVADDVHTIKRKLEEGLSLEEGL